MTKGDERPDPRLGRARYRNLRRERREAGRDPGERGRAVRIALAVALAVAVVGLGWALAATLFA